MPKAKPRIYYVVDYGIDEEEDICARCTETIVDCENGEHGAECNGKNLCSVCIKAILSCSNECADFIKSRIAKTGEHPPKVDDSKPIQPTIKMKHLDDDHMATLIERGYHAVIDLYTSSLNEPINEIGKLLFEKHGIDYDHDYIKVPIRAVHWSDVNHRYEMITNSELVRKMLFKLRHIIKHPWSTNHSVTSFGTSSFKTRTIKPEIFNPISENFPVEDLTLLFDIEDEHIFMWSWLKMTTNNLNAPNIPKKFTTSSVFENLLVDIGQLFSWDLSVKKELFHQLTDNFRDFKFLNIFFNNVKPSEQYSLDIEEDKDGAQVLHCDGKYIATTGFYKCRDDYESKQKPFDVNRYIDLWLHKFSENHKNNLQSLKIRLNETHNTMLGLSKQIGDASIMIDLLEINGRKTMLDKLTCLANLPGIQSYEFQKGGIAVITEELMYDNVPVGYKPIYGGQWKFVINLLSNGITIQNLMQDSEIRNDTGVCLTQTSASSICLGSYPGLFSSALLQSDYATLALSLLEFVRDPQLHDGVARDSFKNHWPKKKPTKPIAGPILTLYNGD